MNDRMESTEMGIQRKVLPSLGGLLLALAVVVSLVPLSPAPVVLAEKAAVAERAVLIESSAVATSNLPAETCVLNGAIRTCHLWAMTGTLTLPDSVTVPVWGFADNAVGPAQVPGPVIVGNAGETLEVVLHNDLLTETMSLTFPGQMGLLPDLEGVAAGGVVTYTFDIDQPGTFLYEAGMTENGMRQVVMGLYGALVVRPAGAAGQAYDDVNTAFDDEALLVLGAIDPDFNDDPYGFSMQFYRPRYWLINGKAYSQTVEIETAAGHDILLRYVNATHETQGMGILGLQQLVIGSDGRPLNYPYRVVNETIAAGQTFDMLTSVPSNATVGTKFALYNTSLFLHNANQRLGGSSGPLAFGGMMTFIDVVTGEPSGMVGPLASNLQVSPNPSRGTSGAVLNATISDVTTGGQNVAAAEYFIDDLGAPGSGIPMSGVFGTPTVAVNALVPAASLIGLPTGEHAFYVRGQDSNGTWGAVNSTVLLLDRLGPATINLAVSPSPTNGSVSVVLHATGDDTAFGNTNVVAAEYRIDSGPAQPMSLVTTGSPIAELQGTIPAATVVGLTEGAHAIFIRSQDVVGNWGLWAAATLEVDKTGPAAGSVAATPSYLDLSGAPPVTAVRLDGVITDPLVAGVNANVTKAEGFIDTVGAAGSGFPLLPQDGVFDETSEGVYYDIPIVNFTVLRQGDHTLYVRGKDAAGNWGATTAVTVTVWKGITDTVGPIITVGPSVTPNPTGGQLVLNLTATAADPDNISNIAAAEWFRGADPGPGNGMPLQAADGTFDAATEALTGQLDARGWGLGPHQISVRAMDEAGNWGPVVTITVNVDQLLVFLPLVMR
jgi:hypothetical protein